jgi:hypothetical protein
VRSRSGHAIVAPIILALSVVSPVAADDVHLKNGRVFEDVLARVNGEVVTIQLAFGSMGVPLESVDRIERAESSLVAYRERHTALLRDAAAGAAAWIDLARWAWQRGNHHGAREAAAVAAQLDPLAEGLDELMPRFDFVFEPQLGRWVTVEEGLRLKGYQQVDGQWLSPEQQLARARLAEEASRAREAEQESRLTRAVLAMAAAQMAREPEPYGPPYGSPYGPDGIYDWPVAVYPSPFFWPHPGHHGHGHHGSGHHGPWSRHDPTAIPIHRRQPGSLFPVAPSAPPARHHGGILPAGGSGQGSSAGSGGR